MANEPIVAMALLIDCSHPTELGLRINPGININETSIPAAKVSATHCSTWTKKSVFQAAVFAFFEMRPIHIPNQVSVARSAATTRTLATASAEDWNGFAAGMLC